MGPGYIKAYELERRSAKYPRVILDSSLIGDFDCETAQDLIEMINSDIKFGNWKGNILYDWAKAKRYDVGLNQDMPLFIDYFQKFFEPGEDNSGLKYSIAQNISTNIKETVIAYEKYRWIADYYSSKFRMDVSNKEDDETRELLSKL